MSTRTLLLALAAALPCAASAPAPAPALAPVRAKVFLTVEKALELAFEGCVVTRGTAILTGAEKRRARELAGSEVESALVFPYVATRDGKLVGTAYFDTHRVRTLRETLMVVVTPRDTIGRVEVLSFDEPLDYVPRDSWYAQFPKKRLDDELNLKRGIKGVTGATLTARATTEAARRVLALHRVVGERPAPAPASSASDTSAR